MRDPRGTVPEPDAPGCASLPADALGALADLRREPGVTVTRAGGRAWVAWPPGAAAVVRRVLPRAGSVLYARRDGLWHRRGDRLPAFDVPDLDADAVPLSTAVTPAPVRPVPADAPPPAPASLTLARDTRPRDATALACGLDDLARWAEGAPTARIDALRGALAGDRVLVLGRPLPPIPGGERFWGGLVLTPLGFRPDPDLPEPALRRSLGAGTGEIVVLSGAGAECVPPDAFQTLTRAGIRLARVGRGS